MNDYDYDWISAHLLRQQGDDATLSDILPLVCREENPEESRWIVERMASQEDLPLPPDNERGAVEGVYEFHVVGLIIP